MLLDEYTNKSHLPEEIIEYISSFTNNKCHTCNKKIQIIEDYIKYHNLIFCSEECFNHT